MLNDSEFVISQELRPDEKLIWSGQPKKGIHLRDSDLLIIVLGMFGSVFAFFIGFLTIIMGGLIGITLLGVIPFIVIGLYMAIDRIFVEALVRKNTFYGLTTDRVIIITRLLRKKVKEIGLRRLENIKLMPSEDGSGSIAFGSLLGFKGANSRPFKDDYFSWCATPDLEMISNAKEVYEKIVEAQKTAQQTPIPNNNWNNDWSQPLTDEEKRIIRKFRTKRILAVIMYLIMLSALPLLVYAYDCSSVPLFILAIIMFMGSITAVNEFSYCPKCGAFIATSIRRDCILFIGKCYKCGVWLK